ncbi:MAG TPA: hypothetical protein VKV80_20030 [Streptosporangiaceae bacterium]|jgi:hypothetical protein|nr:hypothetical protein [Streptosporangiaceae bacterium]
MPSFPPGTDQHVNPAVTPTWIFTPVPGQAGTLRLHNDGQYPVYVGPAGVSQPGGFAVPAGSRPVQMQNVTQTLYAVSGVVPGAQAATASPAAVTAGSTAVTLAAAVPSALAAGTTVIIGNPAGTGWEAQVVASTTASSQITFASPLVSDHAGSSLVYTAVPLPGQLRVTAGVA